MGTLFKIFTAIPSAVILGGKAAIGTLFAPDFGLEVLTLSKEFILTVLSDLLLLLIRNSGNFAQ